MRFQCSFSCNGKSSRGSFIGARTGRWRRSGVDHTIHEPQIAWRHRIRAWIHAGNGRNALIVKSGHGGRGARGPDIAIDYCMDPLVGHPGAAAKAAKQRYGRPKDNGRWNHYRTGRKGPGIGSSGVPERIACQICCPIRNHCDIGTAGEQRRRRREGGNEVDRIIRDRSNDRTARACELEGSRSDGQWVHRFGEGCADGLIERHIDGRVGRIRRNNLR